MVARGSDSESAAAGLNRRQIRKFNVAQVHIASSMNERVIVERDGVRIFCLHYLQRGGIISIEVEIVFD